MFTKTVGKVSLRRGSRGVCHAELLHRAAGSRSAGKWICLFRRYTGLPSWPARWERGQRRAVTVHTEGSWDEDVGIAQGWNSHFSCRLQCCFLSPAPYMPSRERSLFSLSVWFRLLSSWGPASLVSEGQGSPMHYKVRSLLFIPLPNPAPLSITNQESPNWVEHL